MRFLRDHFVKRVARNASPNGGDASRVGKQSCCTSGFTEAGRLAPICACFPSYVLMSPALAAAKPRYEPINTLTHYNHLTERCKFRPFLPRLRSRR